MLDSLGLLVNNGGRVWSLARTCTGVVGSYHTGGMAGLRTLVKPLLNSTIIQLYGCQN